MKNQVAEWLKDILMKIGIDEGAADLAEQFITLIIIILIAFIINFILRNVIIRIILRGIKFTNISNEIKKHINRALCRIVDFILGVVILSLLPAVFHSATSKLLIVLTRIGEVILVFICISIVNCFIKIVYEVTSNNKKYKQKPIKGFFQILQIIVYIIGFIIIIAIIIHKSPAGLLTGLGASAAVLSFIFKDTILGFISGIQLSANDMIRPGDWIVVENSPANGTVIDMTLIAITVQNFDNTFVNVPTYSLITGPFQNWRGMVDSGARRMTIGINIDMDSVKICTAEQLESLGKLIEIPAKDKNLITNIELYRMFMTTYLQKNPNISKEQLIMVRYLAPTTQGIPLQLYCFSNNTNWVIYEGIQAEVTEYAIAMCPTFGLKIFQTLATLPK